MALHPRNIKTETSIAKAIKRLNIAQQEMYSSPAKALRLLHLAIDDINRSYISLAKSMGIKMKD